MIILDRLHQLHQLSEKKAVATIGNFDGVHRAHRSLIMRVVRTARKKGAYSMVITFDYGAASTKPTLTSLDHKLLLLEDCGIDYCFVFSLIWL